MKEKHNITPPARGVPNGVLTQVPTEARREAEERLRRTQEVEFTISPNIEEVLFKGGVRVNEMRLNDFLTREPDGRGVVATNRDFLLEEFFKDPTKYIRDKGALNEMQASGRYLSMKRAVKGEVIFDEDIRRLCDKGVNNQPGWSLAAAEVKAAVHNSTKHFLAAAVEEARKPTTTSAPEKLEGLYESVHNVRWSHAVELPDGVERKKTGTGMRVEVGKPEQSLPYRKAGNAIEENDAVQQIGAAPPVLIVLTSEKGWPYSRNTIQDLRKDVFVNCELDRVWRIVKGDLTKWFSCHGGTDFKPERRVLIGTPGIGKSMNAGSYLLYRLLQYDVKKLQVVVHCFGDTAYVSDKTTRAVTRCSDEDMCISELRSLRGHGRNLYIIYGVARKGTPPPRHFAPTSGWGMIVVPFPKVTNYDEWEKQLKASRVIMNCPDEKEVKAMCAWMKRGLDKDEQAEYWKMVEKHMEKVGPIPRHIFDEKIYIDRLGAVNGAFLAIKPTDFGKNFTLGGEEKWYSEDPCHKLVKIVRARTEEGAEVFLNAPISFCLGRRIPHYFGKRDE
ncbi:putative retrotransposon hot spot protein (RHS,) [Trypanosoma cruzi]|uniref:Putative retrotransposon hot spot protein (RHS,) n=1 Tax=Trypanosoma cruzi TaxID=5693 RepID=A0A2V2UUQ7_TRYCR|nr:putative retrotransposon hot spot protein (RHS,) [Trypanosoma cruzi]